MSSRICGNCIHYRPVGNESCGGGATREYGACHAPMPASLIARQQAYRIYGFYYHGNQIGNLARGCQCFSEIVQPKQHHPSPDSVSEHGVSDYSIDQPECDDFK